MNFEDIVEAIQFGRVLPSRHSRKEAADDDLVLGEIYESVLEGELIEEYPDSYLMPSGLILGFNTVGDPIHSVWRLRSSESDCSIDYGVSSESRSLD